MPNDTIRDSLNRANPNTLADHLRRVRIGDIVGSCTPQVLRSVNPDAAGVSPYNLSTLDALVLPEAARAAVILRAFAKAGGVTGALTVAAKDATPTTGQIAIAPNGNIVTLGTDALTSIDVFYIPEGQGIVMETVFPVVSNAIALPANLSGKVAVLEEVEVLTGTATGKKVVLTRGGSPSAGQAALNLTGTTVSFASADAATRARLKMFVALDTADQLQTVLASLSPTV